MGDDPRRKFIICGLFLCLDRLLTELRLSLEDDEAQKSMLLWARTRDLRFAPTNRPTPRSQGSRKDRLIAPTSLF
jgi:hypothetical protein